MRVGWPLVFALMIAACATSRGFDQGALRAEATAQGEVSEEEIARALALKPQLPKRFRLAVYFAPQRVERYRYVSASQTWVWTGEDKDEILKMAGPLKEKGIVEDMYVVPDSVLEGSDRRAIRLGAARSGADAVLIVGGASDIDRYNNKLGYSYVLLVTPLFVPGTVADGIFMAHASMWDVRNDYLYLSGEAEGTASQTAPPILIEEGHLIRQAKVDAVKELQKQVSARLLRLGDK